MATKWQPRKAAQRAFPERQPCSKCGALNAQRHHPDLSKPLEIEWLCPQCHADEDQRLGKWGRGAVKPANCEVCRVAFRPKRSRRAKLCGNPECSAEMGRRAAEKRWSASATASTDCGCSETGSTQTRLSGHFDSFYEDALARW
jgi:hypothetical protein